MLEFGESLDQLIWFVLFLLCISFKCRSNKKIILKVFIMITCKCILWFTLFVRVSHECNFGSVFKRVGNTVKQAGSSISIKSFKALSNLGNPPTILLSKAKDLAKVNKFHLILDKNTLGNIGRFYDKDYVNKISKAEIILDSLQDSVVTAVTKIGHVVTNEEADAEVEWSIEDFLVDEKTLQKNQTRRTKDLPIIRSLGKVRLKMKNSELENCFKQLKVSKSREAVLIYTCYHWSNGPDIFFWCLVALFIGLYLLLPPLLATLYIRGIQGESKSCLLVSTPGKQKCAENEQRRLKGKSLCSYIVFAILSVIVFISLGIFFLVTNYDLTTEYPSKVLLQNQLVRAGISIAGIAVIIMISQINTSVKMWRFPLLFCICPCRHKDEEGRCSDEEMCFNVCCRPCIFWCCIHCLVMELAFNIFRVIMKIFYCILFGIPFY